MRFIKKMQLRIRSLFRRPEMENDLNDELHDYLERETERQISAGVSQEQARKTALANLHGIERVKEECRDTRGTRWVEAALSDLNYAFRMVRKDPEVTFAIVAALAFCIGLNAAIFSIVDTVLFRPLPFPNQNRLVSLTEGVPALGYPAMPFTCPDYLFISVNSQSFESTAVYRNREYEVAGAGEPRRVDGARISASLFQVLGVSPLVGRMFTPSEDDHSARVVVLTHSFAKTLFGGSRPALGRTILLDRKQYAVIGVMPESFSFPIRGSRFNGDPAELFVPVSWDNDDRKQTVSIFDYSMIARLRPKVTIQQANAEIDSLIKHLAKNYPASIKQMLRQLPNFSLKAQVLPFREEFTGKVERPFALLMAAVGVVLLIGCSDVANLVFTRMAARLKEFTIRAALGASFRRLTCQALIEGLLFSTAGGIAGLCLAYLTLPLLIRFAPESLPRASEIGFNWRMAAFVAAVALVTPLVFCVAPFVSTMRSMVSAQLHGEGRTFTQGKRERLLMSGSVVVQFSLAFVLLTTAGLLVRSLISANETDPGFRPDHVISMRVTLPNSAYKTPVQIRGAFSHLLARVARIPGVRQSGAISDLPMSSTSNVIVTAEGGSRHTERADTLFCLGDVLGTLGVRLAEGRLLQPYDYVGGRHVAVISEGLAKRMWPNRVALGRRIKFGVDDPKNDEPWLTVIGVVADVKAQLTSKAPHLAVFTTPADWVNAMDIIVRTSGNPLFRATSMRQQLSAVDPNLPVGQIETIDKALDDSLSAERFRTWLLTCFALAAMLLAMLGIGGLLGYSTAQRTQEFALRAALGANPIDLIRLVVWYCFRLSGAGVIIGSIASLGVTRAIAALLYDTSPFDPAAFGATAVTLVVLAFGAAIFPIWRVTHINPIASLRAE